MTNEALTPAIEQLEEAHKLASHNLARAQAEVEKIEEALRALKMEISSDLSRLPRRQDMLGLGIVEAAEKFLAEVGVPKTTKEIADELIARGVKTKSKRYVPTVYATLDNASRTFTRVGDGPKGKWTLKQGRK